jgi:hypothetical protein
MKAPNALPSVVESTIAHFPIKLRLPFLTQTNMSFWRVITLGGNSISTKTQSSNARRPRWTFEERKTKVPNERTSLGEYVKPM